MGCNCKVNKKISIINEKYGTKPLQKKTNIIGMINDNIARVIMIICLPFVILHVLYVAIFSKDKRITLSKMFSKKK